MDGIMKAGVITWLLKQDIKVVHVWKMGKSARPWTCMVETPPSKSRGGVLTSPPDQRSACGVGDTALKALLAALEQIDGVTIEFRLHLLEFMVEHLANRAAPAALRRIENGARS